MGDISEARSAVQAAADDAGGVAQEQLRSVDEGLAEIAEGDKTADAGPHPDRLREIERKLSGLADEVEDDRVRDRIEDAQARVGAYRDDIAREE